MLALMATTTLAGVLLMLWALDTSTRPTIEVAARQQLPIVSVVEVVTTTQRATIRALSEAQARHTAVLRTQTSGEIVMLSSKFMPGENVSKGTVLLQIEDSPQRTLVAEAENRLAQAELALLTEEKMATVAAASWRLSGKGNKPPSPLTLREPQLAAARAEQKAAVIALNEAGIRLSHAGVQAPFNGVIKLRQVSLGETIDIGQAIGVIVDRETIDITVHLNARDWALLPDNPISLDVTLREPSGIRTWPATVRAMSGVVDEVTRLRRLYLLHQRDPNRDDPLLPGTFVEVSLAGKAIENILQLPESALTRDGEIWLVDDNDRLARYAAELIFSRSGTVFVRPPDAGAEPIQVAVNPLASFVAGDRVDARTTRPTE